MRRKLIDLQQQRTAVLEKAETYLKEGKQAEYRSEMEKVSNMNGEIKDLQEEVRLHDPVIALDGKEDGLYYYRRIVRESRSCLEEGGMLLFEIGCDQAEAVSGLMSAAGFREITVKKDLAGLDRVVSGVLK